MNNLEKYRQKRNFEKTPEPSGNILPASVPNRFVIQKHAARRLHYDFRLQVGDALVSWAIPKEPIYDINVKRLAVKVEDHPLDYYDFEGVIPKGNYGAGTVMVWDAGTYYLNGDHIFDPQTIQSKIKNGGLKVYLEGKKLKGNFTLFELKKTKEANQWIFMKSKDEFSESPPVVDLKSVKTGRTMEEITINRHSSPGLSLSSMEGVIQEAFPERVKPMLATLGDEAFSNPSWIYEIKLDGYRIQGYRHKEESNLLSRNGINYNAEFDVIHDELKHIPGEYVIDGEMVVLDEEGKSRFQLLQNLEKKNKDHLFYYIFDIYWLNGYNLFTLPLLERKKLLQQVLPKDNPRIKYCDHVVGKGIEFFEQLKAIELEGMIAKKVDSRYYPGKRSPDWIKVKTEKSQEVVICGYTPPKGLRGYFGSLVMAVNEGKKLRYAGKVGTGFTERLLKEVHEKMQVRETSKPVLPDAGLKEVTWVKPELVAEVKFSEWTDEKSMRHPRFKGLRKDKKEKEITAETPGIRTGKINTSIALSNPEKNFWPGKKITKQDVFNYYASVSGIILPYLVNRPQSLYRTPNGIQSKGFFQKNVEGQVPQWVKTVKVESSSSDKSNTYFLCQDEKSLLFLINWGCIELNPWNSSLPHLDNPDYVVFDLDPVDIEFHEVVNVARGIHELFQELDIPFYCKTSGSKGMHVYMPLFPAYTHKQGQDLARLIETFVHQRFKATTSFERSPAKRKGKVYLDFLQNGKGKTMASVYSIRPKEGAMVSTPIEPSELTNELNPADFNLFTIEKRIARKGDVWEGLFKNRVNMLDILEKLNDISV